MSDWVKIRGIKYQGERRIQEQPYPYFVNLDKISLIQMDNEDKKGGIIYLHEYEDGMTVRIYFDYNEKINLCMALGVLV